MARQFHSAVVVGRAVYVLAGNNKTNLDSFDRLTFPSPPPAAEVCGLCGLGGDCREARMGSWTPNGWRYCSWPKNWCGRVPKLSHTHTHTCTHALARQVRTFKLKCSFEGENRRLGNLAANTPLADLRTRLEAQYGGRVEIHYKDEGTRSSWVGVWCSFLVFGCDWFVFVFCFFFFCFFVCLVFFFFSWLRLHLQLGNFRPCSLDFL